MHEHDSKPVAKQRLASLDAFRGLTILLMLVVNNIALDRYTPDQFLHAKWNEGVTLADLIFPWFLLCVGTAVPFSLRAQREKGYARWMLKAFTRTLLIFAVGLIVDSAIQQKPFFGMGVLQLIALAYGVAALFAFLRVRYRLAVASLLLIAYGGAIMYLPVPGLGAPAFQEDLNLLKWLNDNHLRHLGLAGILSTVPAAALVLIGSAAGQLLAGRDTRAAMKVLGLFVGGILLAVVGWYWSLALPFNKPVWTSSYILFTAGLGCILQAVFYALLDVPKKGWAGYSLIVFGSNAVLAYAGAILVKVMILQVWTLDDGRTLKEAWLDSFVTEYGRIGGGWAFTWSYIAAIWIVLAVLYHRRIFVRL